MVDAENKNNTVSLRAIPIFSFSAAEEVVSSPAGVKKCIASGVKSVNPSTLPFTVTETFPLQGFAKPINPSSR